MILKTQLKSLAFINRTQVYNKPIKVFQMNHFTLIESFTSIKEAVELALVIIASSTIAGLILIAVNRKINYKLLIALGILLMLPLILGIGYFLLCLL